jgi:hypothetical protein
MSQYQFTTFGSCNPITTSDTAANHFKALLVCAAGNVAFVPLNGAAITMTSVPAGALIPVETSIVKATGTTATLAGLA